MAVPATIDCPERKREKKTAERVAPINSGTHRYVNRTCMKKKKKRGLEKKQDKELGQINRRARKKRDLTGREGERVLLPPLVKDIRKGKQ